MILVDSSVWIDFLESASSPDQAYLSELIHIPDLIGIPGPVVQEVLQGIRDEATFQRVRERLDHFPVVQANTETYVKAASLYRTLVRHGVTVPSGDVTIAALVLQHACELYTLDRRHFERIRQHSLLRLHELPRSMSP